MWLTINSIFLVLIKRKICIFNYSNESLPIHTNLKLVSIHENLHAFSVLLQNSLGSEKGTVQKPNDIPQCLLPSFASPIFFSLSMWIEPTLVAPTAVIEKKPCCQFPIQATRSFKWKSPGQAFTAVVLTLSNSPGKCLQNKKVWLFP